MDKFQSIKFNKAIKILDRYLEGKEVEKRVDPICGTYIVPLAMIVNDDIVLDTLKKHYKATLEELEELNLAKLLEDDGRTKKAYIMLLKREEVSKLNPLIRDYVAFSTL